MGESAAASSAATRREHPAHRTRALQSATCRWRGTLRARRVASRRFVRGSGCSRWARRFGGRASDGQAPTVAPFIRSIATAPRAAEFGAAVGALCGWRGRRRRSHPRSPALALEAAPWSQRGLMAKPMAECPDDVASVPTRRPEPRMSTTRQVRPSLTPLPFEAPPLPEGASDPPPPPERRSDPDVGRYSIITPRRFARGARK